MADDAPPPSDMLATVPLGQLRVCESVATKLIPAMTPELCLSLACYCLFFLLDGDEGDMGGKKGNSRGAGTARIEDLDAKEAGLLGNAIGGRADGTGDVGAVAVAVRVRAVDGIVQEGSTALKFLWPDALISRQPRMGELRGLFLQSELRRCQCR